jgi:transcriptional regulator with XRE-family HTH domain
MNQGELRPKRVGKNLSLERVAIRLDRTRSWLSKVELGHIRLRKERVDLISEMLDQLSGEHQRVQD